MKKGTKQLLVGLAIGGAVVGGYFYFRKPKNGEPNLKLLPFTEHDNGLAVLNFKIDEHKIESILSEGELPAGVVGDIIWTLNIDGLKNITINAFNDKTKKRSTINTKLPKGMSLVKTR